MNLCMVGFPRIYEGFHGHGGTPQWLVKKGKSHLEMDDLGVPLLQETSIISLLKGKHEKWRLHH